MDCLTCGFPLCPKCLESHKRPAYKHHQLGDVGSLAKRRKIMVTRTCKDHNEETKLFCDRCDSLVCTICTQGGAHDAHPCNPVMEAATLFPKKEKLTACLEEAITEIKQLDGLLEEGAQELQKATLQSTEACQKAIGMYVDNLQADSEGKVASILRQRVALIALQRRIRNAFDLFDGASHPAEVIAFAVHCKALARDVSRSLVTVPPVAPLTVDGFLQALPPLPVAEGAIHKMEVRKLRSLLQNTYEFAPTTPDAVFINGDQRVMSSKTVTAVATGSVTTGTHRWSIRVTGNPPNQMVGIVPVGTPLVGSINGRFGWLLNTATGRVFFQAPPGAIKPLAPHGYQYASPVNSGSVVTVKVDMDRHTLAFSIDGRDCGVCCRDLPNAPLFPAVSFTGSGSFLQSAEFVEDTEGPYTLLGHQPTSNGPMPRSQADASEAAV